jgi:hypothetical protein
MGWDALLRRVVMTMAALCVCMIATEAAAYPKRAEPYLFRSQLPDASKVTTDVKGADEFDTLARRHAAFVLLDELVNMSADGSGQLPWPSLEQRLHKEYGRGLGAAYDIAEPKGLRQKLFAYSASYQGDPAFTRPLLQRYLSEAAIAQIEPTLGAIEGRAHKAGESLMAAYASTPQAKEEAERAAMPAWALAIVDLPTYVWALAIGAWLFIAINRSYSPFAQSQKNPLLILVGPKRRTLRPDAGQIIDEKQRTEIKTRRYTSTTTDHLGNRVETPYTTVTSTEKHDIFYRRGDGSEGVINLTDFPVSTRKGHHLGIVWADLKKKSTSALLIHVYETQTTKFVDHAISSIVSPPGGVGLPVVLLGFWAGLSVVDLVAYVSNDAGDFGWIAAAVIVIASALLYLLVKSVLVGARVRKFKKQFATDILAVIPDPRASAATS